MQLDTKSRILKSADKLFRQIGVRNVTMDDIATELGMSKKTIYKHYKNKSEIVFGVTKKHIGEEKRDFEEMHNRANDSVEEMVLILHWIAKTMKEISPTMVYDIQKYYPRAWREFLSFKSDYIYKHICKNLEKGIIHGLYRKEMNISIIAKMRTADIDTIMDPQIFPLGSYDITEVHLQVLEHFLHGLVTLKGKKLITKYLHK